MGRQHRRVEVVAAYRHATELREHAGKGVDEPALRFAEPGGGGSGGIGERDQGAASVLRQRAHEGLDELAAIARDLPVEHDVVELVERRERDAQGDAIERLAGREAVRERDVEVTAWQGVWVVGEADDRSVGVAQLVGGEIEKVRLGRRGIAPPPVEVS